MPFSPVGREILETHPAAFTDGPLTRKAVEWVVRWYCCRSLGAFLRSERRAVEGAFRDVVTVFLQSTHSEEDFGLSECV